MAQSKPFTYELAEVVMQYMEANQRHFLAAHSLPLRRIHKSVPFNINYLKLDETEFTVNDYQHTFSSFMESHPSYWGLPIHLINLNTDGGVPYDIDMCGNKDRAEDIEQGDLRISEPRDVVIQDFDEYRRWIRRGRGNRNHGVERHAGEEPPMEIHGRQTEIDSPDRKRPISPFPTDREDFPYIQLTLQYLPKPTPFCLQKRVKYPIGVKIRDAIRQHLGTFITEKTVIRTLEVNMTKGILRIPDGLQFRIFNFKTCNSESLNNMESIIEVPDVPGTSMTVRVTHGSESVFRLAVMKKFKSLKLLESLKYSIRPLKKLENTSVFVTGFRTNTEEIASLARNWVQRNRSVATKLSLEVIPSGVGNYMVNALQNVHRRLRGSEWEEFSEENPSNSVCMPMSSTKKLVICAEKVPNTEIEWLMVMEVKKIEDGGAAMEEPGNAAEDVYVSGSSDSD